MMIDHLRRDLRQAVRSIARMPGLALVVILSLGVGIGVNTAVFSWLEAVVLNPLPGVPFAGRFMFVEPRNETGSYPGLSWPEYRDVRERLQAFQALIAFRMVPLNVGEASRTERTYGMLVSDNYFSGLGMRPAAGRFFRADEVARPGGEPVLVISHDFWLTRFAGRSDAIGRTVRVNDRDLTIIGVTPEGFQGTVLALDFDLFVPATLAPTLLAGSTELEQRSQRGYSAMGLLAPGASMAQAETEVASAMRELAAAYPTTNTNLTAEVRPFWRATRGPQQMFAGALALLQGLMLLLLAAVCGNTANLLLARASVRRHEIGVRLAIGAGPWRVASLLLTESLVLALGGAVVGAALAVWGTDALRAVPMLGAFPIRFQTRIDAIGLAFAMALGVGCGLLFGALPALHLARIDPQHALRAGARAASRTATRRVLMATEVAIALLVLSVAAFFLRSFRQTREIDPGFQRDGVLLTAYDLTGRQTDDASARLFAGRLLERLAASPGVQAAAIATSVPLDIHGLPQRGFVIEGHSRTDGGTDLALSNTVTPGYFTVMGIPLRAGSDFTGFTDRTTPPQVIVNEEFVRRYVAAGGQPLGRKVENRGRSYFVAGVVANSLYEAFGEPPKPIVYFSYRDRPSANGEIHVRTRAGGEALLAPEVSRAVRDIDPSLPVYDVRSMTEHVEKNLFLRRIPARMFAVLGPLLLMLAAIGIYAVVAYGVAQRTAEIGVRLALGAGARRVVREIVIESLRVIIVGVLFGWTIVLMVDMHLIRGGASDVPILLGVPAILLFVSALASWLPARRAAGVDPVVALRED